MSPLSLDDASGSSIDWRSMNSGYPSALPGYSWPVTRLLAAAAIALATAFVLILSGVAQASADQTLSIDLSGPQPRIDRLTAYTDDAPVHVRVTAPKDDRVAIQGTSPDGSPVDVLLTRGPDGVFAGDLPLGTSGDWSLAADASIGTEDAVTDHFTLSAVDPPSTNTAGLMIALGGISVFGGIGLLAVGRRASARSVPTRG